LTHFSAFTMESEQGEHFVHICTLFNKYVQYIHAVLNEKVQKHAFNIVNAKILEEISLFVV
jgi:predicted RNA-binding protein with RPS1 domain